jgi:hypothetical protein
MSRWWVRLLASLMAALGAAFLVAIASAILDLYLTGHGLPSLSRPLVDGAGLYLSLADVVCLGAAAGAGVIVWRLLKSQVPGNR